MNPASITHISYDLETWGKRPGCDLRSIGACVFDPLTGMIGKPCNHCSDDKRTGLPGNACENCMNTGEDMSGRFYIATRNGEQYGLIRDPETVQWWSEQSDEAKAAFENPTDLDAALNIFREWLKQFGPNVRMWSHGAGFDAPILAAAYHTLAYDVPWHYRAVRDTRTIFEAAGMDVDTCLADFQSGTHHHALDDAITQARAVCEAYRHLELDSGRPISERLVRMRAELATDVVDSLKSDMLTRKGFPALFEAMAPETREACLDAWRKIVARGLD